MTDREFENYLALLSGMLRLRRTQRESISGELRDHLIEHVAQLEANGSTHEEAVRRALEEFGDAAALAANFQALVGMRRRRLIMRCTIGTTVVMTGLVVAMLAFRPDVVDDPGIAKAQDAPKVEVVDDEPAAEDKSSAIVGRGIKSQNERANDATRKKLDWLIDVDFNEVPLGVALESFSKQVGTQVYLDPRALVDLAITSDDPVSLSLKQVPGEMALDLLLRPIQLSYTLRNGVIMVSSQAEIDANPEVRVYYVPADSTHQLIELIPLTVAPTTWAAVGGLGSIRPFRDSLVISQTSEVHQDIEKLLKDLEPALAKGPRKQAADGATGDGYGQTGQPGYGAVGYGGTSPGRYGAGGVQPGYGQTGAGGYGSTSGGGYGRVGGQPGYGATGSQPGYGATRPERGERRPGRNDRSRESKPTPSIEPATGDSPLQPADDSAPAAAAPDDNPFEPAASDATSPDKPSPSSNPAPST
jgi:hypothetical protein